MKMMSEAEMKIAEWVWANPGIRSMNIVKLCEQNYGWKQSTVFTLIRRMREKECLRSVDSRLYMIPERDVYFTMASREYVKEHYNGNIAAFLTSYLKDAKVSKYDAGRLMNIIRTHTEE